MTDLWDALATVVDPELDRPITDLGFVSEAVVVAGHARVRLRLPTYFCAPNFAYLMVADAYDAVRPLAKTVDVQLEDHFAAEEINAGVAASAGFTGAFPGLASAELDELRVTFQRKAYLASLDRVLRVAPAAVTIADVPSSPELTAMLRRRAVLDLDCAPDSVLRLDEHGAPLTELRARYARSVRLSIDGNASFCGGLLRTRYPEVVND